MQNSPWLLLHFFLCSFTSGLVWFFLINPLPCSSVPLLCNCYFLFMLTSDPLLFFLTIYKVTLQSSYRTSIVSFSELLHPLRNLFTYFIKNRFISHQKKFLLNSFSIDCKFCHTTWTTLRMPLKEEQSNIPGVTHWIPWNNCFLCDVIILLALSLQIFCTQLFIFHRCSTVRIIVIKQFPIALVFLIES